MPKRSAPLAVCLVFPNTYHTGMSNLAVHTLYGILNTRTDCLCERSFCDEHLLGSSLETGSPLGAFHVIAFSISFELDYPNVPKTLLAARVPLRATERNESHPLIIAGGPCMFSNPEPLADYIDACVIGEGEEAIGEVMTVVSKARENAFSRTATLRELSQIPGVYVPSLYNPVYSAKGELVGMENRNGSGLPITGRVVADLDEYPCASVLVTPNTEFANMFLVELGRGCRRNCRFCSACHIYLRRNRSLDSLKNRILSARGLSNTVGLVTSDLSDYPQRDELLAFLLNTGFGFSVSSVRADFITEDLLAGMQASGQRTLTLAPETASAKLRVLTGKRITAEALLSAVDLALNHSIINFRLYFMIGLPGEEDDDVEAIVELAKLVRLRMRRAAKRSRKMGRLTVCTAPFVPKPFTPLESVAFADAAVLSRRIKLLRRGLARVANTRLTLESPRMARLQCVFARGDRTVAALIEMIARGQSLAQAMREFGDKLKTYTDAQAESGCVRPWQSITPPAAQNNKGLRKD